MYWKLKGKSIYDKKQTYVSNKYTYMDACIRIVIEKQKEKEKYNFLTYHVYNCSY